jgi:hypothetical protein
LSSSWISIARKSSLSVPLRTARSRMAVKDCATVSAMPPNTYTFLLATLRQQ